MGHSTQWLSLIAGFVIFGYGILKLYNERDWVPLVLGLLIVGFTLSKMVKSREGKSSSSGTKKDP